MTNLPSLYEQAILTLWELVNMSLSAYAKLIAQFHTAENTLTQPLYTWQQLNLHASHLERFAEFIKNGRKSGFLQTTLEQIANGEYAVVAYEDAHYPATLKTIFDPPPILFFKGNLQALSMPQIAIVGTRKPSHHANKIAFDIAQYLAFEGIWITSGLAEGIDKQAHLGALSQSDPTKQGRTVAVLGTGIRLCYPRHHQPILQQIIGSGGCVITELLPDNPPNKQGFPRRNRLVAGLSLATLVVEAALKSGSLITANQTNEQGKQVFAIPSHIENEQARGCHQLIREGATLIDHPAQILEDLMIFKSPLISEKTEEKSHVISQTKIQAIKPKKASNKSSQKSLAAPTSSSQNLSNQPPVIQPVTEVFQTQNIPEHLFTLYQQLDWVGQDVDTLVEKTGLDIATLLGQMMELELTANVMQHGGLYMRCRS